VVLLASTLLNAGYFVPVTYRAFFGTLAQADKDLKEASLVMVIPLLITAVISFAIGIFPDFFMSFVKGVLQ
jgi:multicomponent Na+:H+ antiporter subunit D